MEKNKKTLLISLALVLLVFSLGIGVYKYFNGRSSRMAYERAEKAYLRQDLYNADRFGRLSLYYNDENAKTHFLLAKINADLDFFDEVLKFSNWAIEYNGDPDPAMYFLRGKAYYKLNDYMSAKEDLMHSQSLYADIDSVDFYLGKIQQNFKKHDEAIAYYDKHLATDKKSFEALYQKGRCYYELSKYEQAVKFYEAALEIKDDHAEANFLCALAYIELGDTLNVCTYLNEAKIRGHEDASHMHMDLCAEYR
ncbi:MAG: tetratricopeptide repeat protein [Cytophagaceae bacterium]